MSKSIRIRTERIFEWMLSASVILAGLCLMGGCAYIYFGHHAYTSDLVASTFRTVAIPVWIAVGLIAVGLVWKLISPADTEHHKAPKAYAVILSRLHSTREKNEAAVSTVLAEQQRRKALSLTRLILVAVGLLIFFGYAVQPANYTDDINTSVIRAMWVAIPCFAVPFAFAIFTAYGIDKSYQREIAFLKTLPACKAEEQANATDRPRRIPAWLPGVILLGIAVAALIVGAVSGGAVPVLAKAIKICTECIGLG